MTFNLVTTVLQYISPELIAKMAKSCGIEGLIAQKAIGAIVPGILRWPGRDRCDTGWRARGVGSG